MERKFKYAEREKGSCYNRDPYRLPQTRWPEALKEEFAEYKRWRTAPLVAGRSRRFKQRPATFQKALIEFEAYFGYLVNVAGHEVASLHLQDIHDPDLLRAYAVWHAENRNGGEPSRFVQKTIGDFAVIARYYFEVEESTLQAINVLKDEVFPDSVRSALAKWNSLSTLEKIGLAEYPNGEWQSPGVFAAQAAQRSLIIRLWVRRPIRSRNIREMKLGHNLYQTAEGWMLHFRGRELKKDRRNGRENVYLVSFPSELTGVLDEFLKKWRPKLDRHDSEFVFLSRAGKPLSQGALHKQMTHTTYEYTGLSTNPHLIRHIWATEFLMTTQKFTAAATMLGDRLETVLRRYAHLNGIDASKEVTKFLVELL